MPCKDTKSIVSIRLDKRDCLIDFDFAKDTCGKTIGGGTGYKEICVGRKIDDILDLEFLEIVEKLGTAGTEEQFLLYLEWDALKSVIAQYQGRDKDIDPARYQIDSIVLDGEEVEIRQLIQPPKEMPKIIPCRVRAKQDIG